MSRLSINATEKKIRHLVREKGMTNKDFAQHVGINNRAFYSFYNGLSKPSLASLIRIANRCHVSLDWLCGGEL